MRSRAALMRVIYKLLFLKEERRVICRRGCIAFRVDNGNKSPPAYRKREDFSHGIGVTYDSSISRVERDKESLTSPALSFNQ